MYTYVARQPILDIHKHTYGYELLFRCGEKYLPIKGNADHASIDLVEAQRWSQEVNNMA